MTLSESRTNSAAYEDLWQDTLSKEITFSVWVWLMCVFRVFEHVQYDINDRITTNNNQNTECLYSPHVYLEGSHTELDTEAQVNTEVVG